MTIEKVSKNIKTIIQMIVAKHEMDEAIENQAKELAREILDGEKLFIGVDMDDPEQAELIQDWITNNGTFHFIQGEKKDGSEHSLVVVDRATDRFVAGRKVKMSLTDKGIRIIVSKLSPKDGVDPVELGKEYIAALEPKE
jgi:hypothetical protein